MNILIIDQPLCNRGDESAFKGLVRRLTKSYPDSEIKVLEINSPMKDIEPFMINGIKLSFEVVEISKYKWFYGFARRFYNAVFRRVLWMYPCWKQIRRHYKWADIIICSPGGVNLGGFQDWKHLSLLYFAKKIGKPLFYFGRSIGPFDTKDKRSLQFKNYAATILKYCSFVSLRDFNSVSTAHELGVICNQTVDSAFLDFTHTPLPNQIKRILGDSPYIVFVPNELIWHYSFSNNLKNRIDEFHLFVMEMVASSFDGRNIVMLPQTYNQVRRDYDYFCELKSKSAISDRIIVLPETLSSDVQQTIISNCDLVIGGRYHSIVFAINQYKPFISLSYEHKMSGLLKCLGVQERMLDITHAFDNDTNLSKIKMTFIQMLNSPYTKAREVGDSAKRISEQSYNIFSETVDSSK